MASKLVDPYSNGEQHGQQANGFTHLPLVSILHPLLIWRNDLYTDEEF